MSSSLTNSSQELPFFHVLMYSLYRHPDISSSRENINNMTLVSRLLFHFFWLWLQFNCRISFLMTMASIYLWNISNCTNFIIETFYDFPYMQAVRVDFWHQNVYFWLKGSNFTYISKPLKKKFCYKHLSSNLTVEHIQLYKLRLWNYHAYRQVEKTFGTEMITFEKFQSDL